MKKTKRLLRAVATTSATAVLLGGTLLFSASSASAACADSVRGWKTSTETVVNNVNYQCGRVQARITRYVGGAAGVTVYYGPEAFWESYVMAGSGQSAGNAWRASNTNTSAWKAWVLL